MIIVTAVAVAMGIGIFLYPPSIFPDAAHGFQVMRASQGTRMSSNDIHMLSEVNASARRAQEAVKGTIE